MTSWPDLSDGTVYRKDGKSKALTTTQPTRRPAKPTFDVAVAAALQNGLEAESRAGR